MYREINVNVTLFITSLPFLRMTVIRCEFKYRAYTKRDRNHELFVCMFVNSDVSPHNDT